MVVVAMIFDIVRFPILSDYLTMLPKVTSTPTMIAKEKTEPMISARLIASALVVCGCM